MFDHADDALARVVRFPTERRVSFKALGIAGLSAALLAPRTIEAKQSAGKKARKKCKRQVGQCRAAVEAFCERSTFCFDAFSPCCEHLSTCNVTAYLTCFHAVEP
jgi:hypothetical protein